MAHEYTQHAESQNSAERVSYTKWHLLEYKGVPSPFVDQIDDEFDGDTITLF